MTDTQYFWDKMDEMRQKEKAQKDKEANDAREREIQNRQHERNGFIKRLNLLGFDNPEVMDVDDSRMFRFDFDEFWIRPGKQRFSETYLFVCVPGADPNVNLRDYKFSLSTRIYANNHNNNVTKEQWLTGMMWAIDRLVEELKEQPAKNKAIITRSQKRKKEEAERKTRDAARAEKDKAREEAAAKAPTTAEQLEELIREIAHEEAHNAGWYYNG